MEHFSSGAENDTGIVSKPEFSITPFFAFVKQIFLEFLFFWKSRGIPATERRFLHHGWEREGSAATGQQFLAQ